MSLRIIFMGTPDFSVPTLEALSAAGHEIVACYTQPPRPAGRRGLELKPSPVQMAAERRGIPVFSPTSLKGEEEQALFGSHGADVAVVVAYGLLLPQAILDAPKHGCFNGHASLLPRWRGAAPIQRAIMAGDKETGIMVMRMEAGLDTGPVAMQARTEIGDKTAGDLHDELAQMGAELMVRAMAALEAGTLTLESQTEDGVLYAAKISKEEARIDFDAEADQAANHINGLSPFPGAWTQMPIGGKPLRVKVLSARAEEGHSGALPGERLNDGLIFACKSGAIRFLRLQKAGSKAMDADEFLRGTDLPPNLWLS